MVDLEDDTAESRRGGDALDASLIGLWVVSIGIYVIPGKEDILSNFYGIRRCVGWISWALREAPTPNHDR